MLKAPAHVSISWVFLILIGIVLCYSYFFYPNAHPIDCFIKMRTGRNCPSCGFSRAFSYFMHMKITEGKQYNHFAWPVFLFFIMQFFMRLFVVIHYFIAHKKLPAAIVKSDVLISISAFLLAFLPLLINY